MCSQLHLQAPELSNQNNNIAQHPKNYFCFFFGVFHVDFSSINPLKSHHPGKNNITHTHEHDSRGPPPEKKPEQTARRKHFPLLCMSVSIFFLYVSVSLLKCELQKEAAAPHPFMRFILQVSTPRGGRSGDKLKANPLYFS